MIIHNESKSINNGIGFFGLLQVALIVLKLCKVIDWSWLMVMLPAIIFCSLSVTAIILYFIILYRS
jgi:hypothetical protein